MEKMDNEFLKMIEALVNGIKSMTVAVTEYQVFLKYVLVLVNANCESKNFLKFNFKQKIQYILIKLMIYSLQLNIFRLIHNFMVYLCLIWLPTHFRI